MTEPLWALGRRCKITPIEPHLGKGGEGSVYKIKEDNNLVLKVYSKPIDSDKAGKLLHMQQMSSDTLCSICAWPREAVAVQNNHSTIKGFLMPIVANHAPVHELYSTKNRRVAFPDATWGFLIKAAINIAKATHVVHANNCIIGDFNESGIMVNKKDATVKLIDCDSFQVCRGDKLWLCEVGKPEFTPPELQGQELRNVKRLKNHDYFGLAVMIFYLLSLGYHPFQCLNMGIGLSEAIRRRIFPYLHSSNVSPPPLVLDPRKACTPLIMRMFEQAFCSDARPTTEEWIRALKGLEQSLRHCRNNKSHHYYGSACPFCDIERRLNGFTLFSSQYSSTDITNDLANIERTLAQLQQQIESSKLPAFCALPNTQFTVSQVALDSVRTLMREEGKKAEITRELRNKKRKKSWFVVIILGVCTSYLYLSLWPFFAVFLIYLMTCNFNTEREKIIVPLDKANFPEYDRLMQSQKILESREQARKSHYENALKQHQSYQKMILDRCLSKSLRLDPVIWQNGLDLFLCDIELINANDLDLTYDLIYNLVNDGIKTAADINQAKVMAVNQFGVVRTKKVMDWLQKKHSEFASNHSISKKYLNMARQLMGPRRLTIKPKESDSIKTDIVALRSEIKVMNDKIKIFKQEQQKLYDESKKANDAYLQCKADWDYIEREATKLV